MMTRATLRGTAFADSLLGRPVLWLCGALLLTVLLGAGLAGVSKDPSVDAFVPQDHPAALARDAARDTFGLEDPVVAGLLAPEGETVWTPERLEALRTLDKAVRLVEGVDKTGVSSLASENAIQGNGIDFDVDPVVPDGPLDADAAALARERAAAMPMLSGRLVSADGRMAVLIAPVDDPNSAEGPVADIVRLAAEAADGTGLEVHVAGVASMNARLAAMVDGDTRIFVPAAVLVVLLILLAALRSPLALLGPLVVIAGSAAAAIGLLGWTGSRYYLITTALPVVIMAIAVADSLHICAYYLKARFDNPFMEAKDAAREALAKAWKPVTLTSITTIAAFSGLAFGAAMRPISEFGLFAAVGVAAAWALSLTALPAILVLTDLKPGKGPGSIAREGAVDRAIAGITQAAFRHPGRALAGVAGAFIAVAAFASQAQFDYERQRYFVPGEPVRTADAAVNEALGGVNFLDVVVTAPEEGGLLLPDAQAALRELRQELAALPLVARVSGIDEYISVMHAALTGEADALPVRERAPAQYMFLYEASAPPDDFAQQLDYTATRALVRAQLSTDRYGATRPVVERAEKLAASWSARHGLDARLSGRVPVNTGWMDQLSRNHFIGLGLAVALVFAATLLVFRSLLYAGLAMVPVLFGVGTVYAVMGAFGIDIAPATSMTAAIATGLGVDFGIHLISAVRREREAGASLGDAFGGGYAVVARACFFSAVALGLALAVVCLSSAPPLRWFGLLIAAGAAGSLIGALLIVPALWSARLSPRLRRPVHAPTP